MVLKLVQQRLLVKLILRELLVMRHLISQNMFALALLRKVAEALMQLLLLLQRFCAGHWMLWKENLKTKLDMFKVQLVVLLKFLLRQVKGQING